MSTQAAESVVFAPDNALAQSVVDDTSLLVSPPDVYLKITDMINENTASADAFAEVIACDPSITARLLRLVNSSFYALPSKIDTISRALTIVGMHELTNLVYSICAVESFSRISSSVTNMNTFWRHSVYCGLTAKRLAVEVNCLNPERLFVAGLLHDIGALAINRRFPEIAEQNIAASEGSEQKLFQIERQKLGIDHAHLGALMLESWQIPAATCDAIRYHHSPSEADVTALEAAILNAADTLANASGTGSYSETIPPGNEIDPVTEQLLGIDPDYDRIALLDEVDREFVEMIYLLVA